MSKQNQRKNKTARRAEREKPGGEPTGGGWTPDILRALMANPIYAINIDPMLAATAWARTHEPVPLGEWVAVNAQAIREDGAEAWLSSLLDVLSGGTGYINGGNGTYELFNQRCNPAYAIDIDPDLTVDHEPILTRDVWVQVNAIQMRTDDDGNAEDRTEAWLVTLLDVLSGNYVCGQD